MMPLKKLTGCIDCGKEIIVINIWCAA